MHYSEGEWSQNTISNKDEHNYGIRYPSIVVMDDQIHIILAMCNLSEIGNWSLYHYSSIDNTWNGEKIAQFLIDQDLGPFYMDIYNHDIHLTYGGMLNGEINTFHIKYVSNLHKWLRPQGDKSLPNTKVEYMDEDNSSHAQKGEPDLFNQVQALTIKAETAYKTHISITRESDELRRRCMESKRQWELILEELNEFKISSSKLKRGNILGNLLKSILQ